MIATLQRCIVVLCICVTSTLLQRNGAVTVNEVVRLEKQATKFNDEKAEMENYMRKEVNWGDHLAPAPYTAAILGGLIQLTGKVDFELVSYDSTAIRHPDSFRATLSQLCHESYEAFSSAHHGMDDIHLRMKMLPSDFYDTLKILYRGSIETMNEKIRVPLGYIKRSVETSKTTAEEVDKKFYALQSLLQDILEGCVTKKQDADAKRQVAEMKKNAAEKHRKRQEKLIKDQESRVKEYEGKLKEADVWLEEKLKQFPSGGEMLKIDIIGGILSLFEYDTSMDLNDIADGHNNKEVEKLSLIEQALRIPGMQTMKESLQRLLQNDEHAESMIDLFKKIVTDEDEDGKKGLDLSQNTLDEKFLVILNLTTCDILKDAQRANPEGELKRLMTKKGEDLEAAQFAVFWKEETTRMCKNASKLITHVAYLKNQFVSNVITDKHHEYARNIISLADKVKELANGTLHSIVHTNLSRLITKALKDPGMPDMFKELINLSPEVTFLMTFIKPKGGKEIIQPLPPTGFLRNLTAQFEKLRHKTKAVVTNSPNGESWRGTSLRIAAKGLSLMKDLENSGVLDEGQQASRIGKIRNLVYMLGKMKTIARQQSNQASISKKTPKNDGSVKSRRNNVSRGQFALELAKKRAKEAQANIRRQENELLKSRQRKMELTIKLDSIIDDMQRARTSKLHLDEIIKIIRKAIKAFAHLKEQWTKVVEFFQLVLALIGRSQSACEQFTNYTIAHQADTKKTLMQGLTFKSTYEAMKITYLIETMSGWYYDVSSQYILPRISRLASLFAFDPNIPADEQKMNDYIQELNVGTKLANEDIQKSMLRDQQDFLNNIGGRIRKLMHCYEELLPPVQSTAAANKLEEHSNDVGKTLDLDGEEKEDPGEDDFSGGLWD